MPFVDWLFSPIKMLQAARIEKQALHRQEMIKWSNLHSAIEDGSISPEDAGTVCLRVDQVSQKPSTRLREKK